MSQPILATKLSTTRIDELFQNLIIRGLDKTEYDELLTLLAKQGLDGIKENIPNVD